MLTETTHAFLFLGLNLIMKYIIIIMQAKCGVAC